MVGGPLYKIKSSAVISRASGTGASVIFGENLQVRWSSKDATELLNLLLQDAVGPVSAGNYSRRWKVGTVDFEYGNFSENELKYIDRTIIHRPNSGEL